MPAPKERSRSQKRTQRRVPGGKTVQHYRREKPKKAHCAGCGKPLAGVPRERPAKMKNLPKSQKRPSRPYGGTLCSSCMRKKMVEKARGSE